MILPLPWYYMWSLSMPVNHMQFTYLLFTLGFNKTTKRYGAFSQLTRGGTIEQWDVETSTKASHADQLLTQYSEVWGTLIIRRITSLDMVEFPSYCRIKIHFSVHVSSLWALFTLVTNYHISSLIPHPWLDPQYGTSWVKTILKE